MNIDKLEKILQYTFTNKSILQEAITHPSKKLENKHIKTNGFTLLLCHLASDIQAVTAKLGHMLQAL